ncbi:Exodeoxyribonuclease V gamma chain [Mannheimia haemolytica]|uniref:Exodeoxyribonuclease V gamma chain n=1 Tax=Mannheimia haemolytica TaxID=75985 RepID=A0A378MUX3_MANHA|nr:Exodeoxyribonuclease V gamma chain [Mannheimia haemolytica]
MFTLYQSNQISSLAEMLVKIQQVNPLEDPFEPETILIQSQGMAQWLQMQIAELNGVMGNCDFLYPTTFLWQQYRLLFPELPKENIFERSSLVLADYAVIAELLDTIGVCSAKALFR